MEEKRQRLLNAKNESIRLSAASKKATAEVQDALAVLGKDAAVDKLAHTIKKAFAKNEELQSAKTQDAVEIGKLTERVEQLQRRVDEYKKKADSVDELKAQHQANLLLRDKEIERLKEAHKAEVMQLQQDLGKANKAKSVLKAAAESLVQQLASNNAEWQTATSELRAARESLMSRKRKHDQIS
jgi:chromosome segregation ATPase